MEKADTEKLKNKIEEMSNTILKTFSTKTNINTLWDYFKTKCSEIMEDCIPSKTTSTRISQPWITKELRTLSRRKQKLYDRAKKTRKTRDWNLYNEMKKLVQKKCREAYSSYINNIICSEEASPKLFWNYIKNKKNDRCGVAPLKRNGLTFSDSTTKANILNSQFSSVFTSEDLSNMPSMGKSSTPDIQPITIHHTGVTKLLSSLNPHKATAPDSIPARLLKETAKEITPALSLIFQASTNQGKIPSDWKTAVVAPVFKKGDRGQPSNYRPISLTSICCKIMEHIIHSSVLSHLEKYNILSDEQHGFRKKRSCETQLVLTINDLAKALDAGEQIDSILLDFSKAFDKVPHKRLLMKLDHYGVRNNILSWIQDFLSDRTQTVVLEGKASSTNPVTSGVPQGTVLGPLLFLAYINDMPGYARSQTRLFADDCLMYRKVKTTSDCVQLQEDLDNLIRWEQLWQMQFNPDKCEVLTITKKRKQLNFNYTIHGHILQHVDSAKYLGLNISKNLSWNTHVDAVTKKANNTLAFLRRNIGSCPQTAKERAFTTFVRPTIEYAAAIWDPPTQRNINALEMVQRRGARFVMNDYQQTSSVTNMISKLGWEELKMRRARIKTILLFKIVNHLVDIPPEPFLIPTGAITRGHNIRFLLPHTRTITMQYSFFPSAIRTWNTLPQELASMTSLEGFRQALANTTIVP